MLGKDDVKKYCEKALEGSPVLIGQDCGFDSWSGHIQESTRETTNQCFSLSPTPFLTPSPKSLYRKFKNILQRICALFLTAC